MGTLTNGQGASGTGLRYVRAARVITCAASGVLDDGVAGPSLTATVTSTGATAWPIGYNHGAAADATEIFAPAFVAYMPGQPPMDRATFEHYVAGVTDGMPGYTYEILDQIAQGDLVANRITWQGVHSGDLAGVPPTGRSIELRGINMFKVHDGRVVAQWAQLDIFGLLQQIGAIPSAS